MFRGFPLTALLLGQVQGGAQQFVRALAVSGHGLYHLATAQGGQFFAVDVLAAVADLVHHVQAQHQGHAEFHDLHGEVEVALKRVGVHHVDDPPGAAPPPGSCGRPVPPGCRRSGSKCRAGSTSSMVSSPALMMPTFFSTVTSGPVGHMLPRTGQGVEHGRFAAVGIACDSEGVFAHDA